MEAQTAVRITKSVVDRLRAQPKDYFVRDAALKGFALKVTPKGAKVYVVEYRMPGGRAAKKGRYTIGRHGSPWTPDSAREHAKDLLEGVRKGVDPQASKACAVRESVELDFAAYADRFVRLRLEARHRRSASEVQRVIDRDLKVVFKRQSLPQISGRDIVRALDALAERAPYVAKQAHSILRQIFNFAIGRGDLSQSPMAGIEAPTIAKPRDRVLSDAELAKLWPAMGDLGQPYADIYRLLLLTGQRLNEVVGMKWDEVDLESGVWTLPAERAKNDRTHIVPLNGSSLDILSCLSEVRVPEGVFVFPSSTGETPIWVGHKVKTKLDQAVTERDSKRLEREGKNPIEALSLPDWRNHDLRRTVATGLQRLGVRLEVTEAILNHVSGSRGGIVGIYQRHDWAHEKRSALIAWDNFVSEIVSGQLRGNIVSINSVAK